MSEYRLINHVLPAEVVRTFVELEDSLDPEERNAYIVNLRRGQWTLQSIASAAGLTRERVRQIVEAGHGTPVETKHPIPELPVKYVRKPRVINEPHPDDLARLLVLQPLAEKVRGKSLRYREEAKEYVEILNRVHVGQKVTLYHMAKLLGRTHTALRSRLVRYGYKVSKHGKSKAYAPIKGVGTGTTTK